MEVGGLSRLGRWPHWGWEGGGQDDRITSVKPDSLLRENIGGGVADIRVGATVPLCTRQSLSQEH